MCGICGYSGQVDLGVLEAMTATLRHRGPDDADARVLDDVGLGHVRLSIIDLSSAGRQPLANEDGRVWITYNGEVYGHDAMRDRLEQAGHTFRSTSDTEVIVHLYEEHGMGFLEHLRGFFSLGIWDLDRRRLVLARDRLGIKPLYWTRLAGGRIAFASEIKALLRHPEVSRRLDMEALGEYLTYLYIPPPRTIFEGVHKLAPGHMLVWDSHGVAVRPYWDVPTEAQARVAGADVRERLDELDDLLDEAVRLRMRSDVPIGAFLSGGLDSSTIVSYMTRHTRRPVSTFSIVFDQSGQAYDEREFAALVAERFGTEHHEIHVTADVVDVLPKAIGHFDEPFGNPTSLLAYVLSQRTREHVTVVLGGDGGDEVFGGYPRYRGALAAGHAARLAPAAVRRRLLPRVAARLSERTDGRHRARRVREFIEGLSLAPEAMYASWIGYWSEDEKRRLLLDDRVGRRSNGRFLDELFGRVRHAPFLDRLPYVDLKSFLPSNVLEYGDKMSMAHALEMRVPLIDHKLVEFMARVPFNLKVRLWNDKLLLRRLMRGRLPEAVLRRPKLGFNPPMGVWLTRDLAPLVADYLSPERLKRRGLFRPEAVGAMLDAHAAGRRDMTWRVYALLVLECWMRLYMD